MTVTWDALAASLAEEMSAFEESTVLVLVEADRPDGRYVQIWQNPDALWVEVSSSQVLGPDLGVSESVERRIGDLGWAPPDGRDNWRRAVPWPASPAAYTSLADAIVGVWRDVFQLDAPAQLRYRGFISAVHERLVLPELGLEPAPA